MFSLVSRCGGCPLDGTTYGSYIAIGNQDIQIQQGEYRILCNQPTSLVACLTQPSQTFIGGNEVPTQPLLQPGEIYQQARELIDPCGTQNDYQCLPYSQVIWSQDTSSTCPNGQPTQLTQCGDPLVCNKCSITIENTPTSDLCNILCPTIETQENWVTLGYVPPQGICDASYFHLCDVVGCTQDTQCGRLEALPLVLEKT